jgi:hypothetical protein
LYLIAVFGVFLFECQIDWLCCDGYYITNEYPNRQDLPYHALHLDKEKDNLIPFKLIKDPSAFSTTAVSEDFPWQDETLKPTRNLLMSLVVVLCIMATP